MVNVARRTSHPRFTIQISLCVSSNLLEITFRFGVPLELWINMHISRRRRSQLHVQLFRDSEPSATRDVDRGRFGGR